MELNPALPAETMTGYAYSAGANCDSYMSL